MAMTEAVDAVLLRVHQLFAKRHSQSFHNPEELQRRCKEKVRIGKQKSSLIVSSGKWQSSGA